MTKKNHFGKIVTIMGNYGIFVMRMNIYNKSSIIDFYKKHSDSRLPLQIWFEETESKNWKSPNQVKEDYGGSASILKNSRVVFNIKANDYRIVAVINYEHGWVFIKFIGTHKEYDKIDSNTVDTYKPNKKKSPTNKKTK